MLMSDVDASDYESVKLFPTEMRFVTGIARAYDDAFPPELTHLVQRSSCSAHCVHLALLRLRICVELTSSVCVMCFAHRSSKKTLRLQ